MGFTLPHKVNLQTSKVIILSKTRASRDSHHLNQSALRETNEFFRVSGCKDSVIIAKRNTTQENKHKQKGKLEIKFDF